MILKNARLKKKFRFFGADKNTKNEKPGTLNTETPCTTQNQQQLIYEKTKTLRVNLSLTLKRFFLGFGENERLPSRRRRSKLCKHLMHYSKTLLGVNNFLVLLETFSYTLILCYRKFCPVFCEFCEFVSLSSSGSSSSTIIRICRW